MREGGRKRGREEGEGRRVLGEYDCGLITKKPVNYRIAGKFGGH